MNNHLVFSFDSLNANYSIGSYYEFKYKDKNQSMAIRFKEEVPHAKIGIWLVVDVDSGSIGKVEVRAPESPSNVFLNVA